MKNLFLILLTFCSFLCFSQLTVKKLDGTPINNGDVIVFNSTADPQNYLGLKFYNSSNNPINVKIKCEDIVNSPGTDLQLCISPVCVSTIVVGNSYPSSSASVIPANGENGNFDHFLNNSVGDGVNNVEYVLKVYQLDATNHPTGNAVTFTYRYASQLSNQNFTDADNFGVKLKSNLVTSQLDIDASKNFQTEIYDLNGRLVSSQKIVSGANSIDVSNFNSSAYIINFISDEGKKLALKFVKK